MLDHLERLAADQGCFGSSAPSLQQRVDRVLPQAVRHDLDRRAGWDDISIINGDFAIIEHAHQLGDRARRIALPALDSPDVATSVNLQA